MSQPPDSPSPADDQAGRNPADSQPQPVRDVLPPVQPPTAGFLLQLFLIPLVIVSIIVLVWLMFSWLVHMGSDPKQIVRDLQTLDESSWQKAYTLSNMLRNPDHEELRDDAELAGEIAAVLGEELESADASEARIRLRVFLAKALGEFRVLSGLPVLVRAAETEREADERHVRLAAIESIAVLAVNAGEERVRDEPGVMDALLAAAREQSEVDQTPEDAPPSAAEVRSTAAFALGVIGGEAALDELATLLHDASPNARYNAATGLARHGDARAMPTLIEMLQPNNDAGLADELSDTQKSFKRGLVLTNGLNATAELLRHSPEADLAPLREAVEALSKADVPNAVQLRATETLRSFPE